MVPSDRVPSVFVFLVWWAAWNLADFYLGPHTPYSHMLVLLAAALLLGLYVHCTQPLGKEAQQLTEVTTQSA